MHSIRLRGPWQIEPLARYVERSDGSYDRLIAELPAGGKATMPADWSETVGRDFLGVVRYRRTFQKPTGLDPGGKVWLAIEPPRSCGKVQLNGQPLGTVACGTPADRFDVTQRLLPTNTLAIEVEHPALDADGCPVQTANPDAPGGLIGEVRLEIESVQT